MPKKPVIRLTLTVVLEETLSLEDDVNALRDGVRDRLFGAGVFGPETLVDEWSMTLETEE